MRAAVASRWPLFVSPPPCPLPPSPPDTVVSVGDSAISGEAGRWAGNTNQAASKTDALGAAPTTTPAVPRPRPAATGRSRPRCTSATA